MTAPTLTPAAALWESVQTADMARNANAREVAAWCLTHHPDLPIAQNWARSEERFHLLHHAYSGVKSQSGDHA